MHTIVYAVGQVMRFSAGIKNHSHLCGCGTVSHNGLMRHVECSLSAWLFWNCFYDTISQLVFYDLLIFFLQFRILDQLLVDVLKSPPACLFVCTFQRASWDPGLSHFISSTFLPRNVILELLKDIHRVDRSPLDLVLPTRLGCTIFRNRKSPS